MFNPKQAIQDFGWPRIIIFLFLASLFVAAPFVEVRLNASFSDLLNRFGMNLIFVLALVPMVQTGAGLNFGLSIGILAGLLGSTLAMQFGLTGVFGFAGAMLLAMPFALVFGYGYGQLLNRVKGEEMTIAIYVGFAAVSFMALMWLFLPFNSPAMVYGYAGHQLRATISLENFWDGILKQGLAFGDGNGFNFPTAMLLFVGIMMVAVWLFFRSKTGTAMTAVGSNPDFARASGINTDKMRLVSVILSTALGAIGILVYQQAFGFIQVYNAPLFMAFPAVAALLIGGASVNKANMVHVVVGTFLFQGILTMTPSVINSVLKTDISEVIRIILSNGMILYALTRKTKVTK